MTTRTTRTHFLGGATTAPAGAAFPPFGGKGVNLPQPPLPRIVAFYSPAPQMGKSTASKELKRILEARGHKVAIVSFADPLRSVAAEAIMAITGCSLASAVHTITDAKDMPIPYMSRNGASFDYVWTGRDVLIGVGDGSRTHIGEDVWCNAFENRVRQFAASGVPKGSFVICDDMRRENEFDLIENLGGATVRVTRPGREEGTPSAKVEGLLEDRLFDFGIHAATVPALHGEIKMLADVLMRE